MNDFIMDSIPYVLVFLMFILILGIIGAVCDEFIAEKFYLRKDQWACTQKTKKTILVFNAATKTSMPQVVEECTQWTKVEKK